jgi:ABC-type polysaccharide/polyol phosphate export permease
MIAVPLSLDASWAVIMREARIFASYRTRALSRLLTIALSLMLFHYLSQLVHVSRFPRPESYFAFVVGGLVILEIIQSTFQMPAQLYQEMIAGTFERVAVSPFGPLGSLYAMTLFPVLLTFLYGFLTLLIAALGFGMPLHWATLPLALPIGLLAALSFMPFSLVFSALAIAFKQQTGNAYVLTGLSFLSGLYFPTALLPGWIRWASEVQPVTPAVDLLRHVVAGLPLTGDATVDLLKMAVFTLVLLPIATAAVARAFELGRRRGTLMEY